jgi:hypothetical protein
MVILVLLLIGGCCQVTRHWRASQFDIDERYVGACLWMYRQILAVSLILPVDPAPLLQEMANPLRQLPDPGIAKRLRRVGNQLQTFNPVFFN